MRLRRTAAAILTAAALALTAACSSDTTPAAGTSRAADINQPAPALTPDDRTELVFNITWAQSSETDKDDLCAALALYGPDFAADEMQDGAGGSTDLDWDRMAELLGNECGAR